MIIPFTSYRDVKWANPALFSLLNDKFGALFHQFHQATHLKRNGQSRVLVPGNSAASPLKPGPWKCDPFLYNVYVVFITQRHRLQSDVEISFDSVEVRPKGD